VRAVGALCVGSTHHGRGQPSETQPSGGWITSSAEPQCQDLDLVYSSSGVMNPTVKDLLQELERQMPEGMNVLEQLVNLESPSFDQTLVNKLGDYVSNEFTRLGGTVERLPEPDRGNHLMIRFGEESDSKPIMLLGHLDTVWPEGEISRRPFTVDGDIATGPGVFDMKAGIAMMWLALRSLLNLRSKLPAPVAVLLTSNEEIGSPNVRRLVPRLVRDMRAVLVLEPSLPEGVLKTSRNGMGRFVVRALGRSAHSGVNPHEGVNAVEEIAHQILRLQKLGDEEQGTTVTVTMAEGGTRPNMVPAECFVQTDCRTPTSAEADRITEAIRSLTPVLPGSRLEVEGEFRRPPLEPTPGNVRLFELAQEVGSALGREIIGGRTGGASDGNLTSGAGIATLDGLGPIGLGAHQVDEHIRISSLPWRTALVVGLIQRIAATDF
jgi:glutamate carboxypeptidase